MHPHDFVDRRHVSIVFDLPSGGVVLSQRKKRRSSHHGRLVISPEVELFLGPAMTRRCRDDQSLLRATCQECRQAVDATRQTVNVRALVDSNGPGGIVTVAHEACAPSEVVSKSEMSADDVVAVMAAASRVDAIAGVAQDAETGTRPILLTSPRSQLAVAEEHGDVVDVLAGRLLDDGWSLSSGVQHRPDSSPVDWYAAVHLERDCVDDVGDSEMATVRIFRRDGLEAAHVRLGLDRVWIRRGLATGVVDVYHGPMGIGQWPEQAFVPEAVDSAAAQGRLCAAALPVTFHRRDGAVLSAET